MRPPACAICGDEFDAPDGRLVTFAERDGDQQWRERAAATRMVGNPPNVEWFCGVHADAAAALSVDTIDVAMAALTATAAPTPLALPDVVKVAIAPREIGELLQLLRDRMPAIVGDDDATATTTTKRTWSPTDGSQPPNCPYEDLDVTTMSGPLATAELRWDRAMWNDDDAGRRTATIVVEPVSGERFSMSATVGAGFDGSIGSTATQVVLVGEPGPGLRVLIDELAI